MPDVKISALPSGTANASAVVPATNAAGTTTQKITLGAIAALGGGPPASHTHGNLTNAGAIGTTSGLPVVTGASGVLAAGAFGSTSGTVCQGNDARLSDSRTPTSHTHGNITNAGAIGSTSGLPIITTTSGVLTAGSFGTGSGTFCQGNDARLPVAAPTLSYTTTDQTVTTYTLTDATNIAFSAAANATYLVSLLIIANDDSEVGFDAKMVVPAGATTRGGWQQRVEGYALLVAGDPVTDRTSLVSATPPSPGQNLPIRHDFVVITSGTSGTVKLQFAQGADDPGTPITLKAGSWIFAQRIS